MPEQYGDIVSPSRVTRGYMWKSPKQTNLDTSCLFPKILLANHEKKCGSLQSVTNVKGILSYPEYRLSASILLQALGHLHNKE